MARLNGLSMFTRTRLSDFQVFHLHGQTLLPSLSEKDSKHDLFSPFFSLSTSQIIFLRQQPIFFFNPHPFIQSDERHVILFSTTQNHAFSFDSSIIYNYVLSTMTQFTITQDSPWLAPLAGYSDLPFRLLSKSYGCGVCCSEMVSVKGLAFKSSGTHRLLATCPEDAPMVLQLFGSEAQYFEPVMEKLITQGFRNFDLNSGCPVRKVLKSGSGVKLMDDLDKLVNLASVMVKKAAEHPDGGRVGVKFRLGYNKGEDVYIELAKRLEDVGVDWVTLHPRYGKQMFTGQADWSKLALLKQAISIPVVGSGDLFTAEDGHRCIDTTGIDAIMFARGALYDPAIFARFVALRTGQPLPAKDGESLARIVQQHIDLTQQYEGDARSFRKIRSIIPRYAKGLRGIRSLRGSLLECQNWDDLREAAAVIATLEQAELTSVETDVDDIQQ